MRNGETKHIKTNLLSVKQLIQHKSIFYFAQKGSQDDLIRNSEMIGTFILNEKSLLHFIYRPIITIQFQNFYL